MPDVPYAIRRVVQSWIDAGRPSQPAIGWPRDRWLEDFHGNAARLSQLPDRLDRPAVARIGKHAAESPERAVEAYIVVMAWGFGDSVGYGRFRTKRILDRSMDTPQRLHAVAVTRTPR
jgi:hypothetical protein